MNPALAITELLERRQELPLSDRLVLLELQEQVLDYGQLRATQERDLRELAREYGVQIA